MKGVDPDLPAGVGLTELNHLNVVLKDLLLLFIRHFAEQIPHPAPCREERCCRIGLGGEWLLAADHAFQFHGQALVLDLQATQLALDAGEASRPFVLQDFYQATDGGPRLGGLAAKDVLLFGQFVPLRFDPHQGLFDDDGSGLISVPDVLDSVEDGRFQVVSRDTRGLAGRFRSLVNLFRADVVAVDGTPSVVGRPDHVAPALAPQETRQQIGLLPGSAEVPAAGGRLIEPSADPLELLRRDDLWVSIAGDDVAPLDPTDVHGISEQPDHLLFLERFPALHPPVSGLSHRVFDPPAVEFADHSPGGTRLLEQVEDESDEFGTLLFDHQLPLPALGRDVSQARRAVAKAPLGAVQHHLQRVLTDVLPLQLGEGGCHDHEQPAVRATRVELLADEVQGDAVLLEEVPGVKEVADVA